MDKSQLATNQKDDAFKLRELAMMHLTQGGASLEETCEIIKKLYTIDREDFTDEDIEEQVLIWRESCLGKPERSIRSEVENWIESNKSNKAVTHLLRILLRDCYAELGLKDRNEKAQCRVIFRRLCEKGVLEPDRKMPGAYVIVNSSLDELDFMNADTTPFDIRFPMGVHELVEVYKKSVIVLAGEPNAGKTAYMLNIARKNMESQDVMYFSSEMGAAELQIRLKKFNFPLETWKKVRWIAKSGDFHNAINPDGLNIIDYLEVAKDFYEIGGLLTEIFNSLNTGVAVVGLQKPAGRDTGVGGARTLDKARLYLSIEPGVLKIVKGKLWRQDHINPNGMYCKFTLGGGANFKIVEDNDGSRWRRP
jgi:hypothetical protein